MSLRFYFGPSGSGKSRTLYEDILKRAKADLRKNFLIVVPDQFTMQTQKDLVTLSEQGGIMNIDVLSFGRLTHRILEEVGWSQVPVLDDTGKSLVLQKVASDIGEKLPTLGSLLKRQGYIHEAKSAISEFMQYGIAPSDVSKLVEYANGRGALVRKLTDLETLYRAFSDYIQGNFITTEEKLDVLARSLEHSKIIPGSVVVFDGFTGFTPIQNRLIQELMRVCDEVILTLTLGEGENPYEVDGEQKLFYLSKKTVADLTRLAKEAGVPRGEDVVLDFNGHHHRFVESKALAHLEQNLFRYSAKTFSEEQQEIRIFEATSPGEEVQQVGLEIARLIREQKLYYRDIALIIGNLESYAPYVETEFGKLGIPCFIDKNRQIVLNPMIELIRSALELFEQDFSYRSVFHYLRSGLCDRTQEEIDVLENYCIQTGVRGQKKWSRLFTRKTEHMEEEELIRINEIRQQFYDQVAILESKQTAPAKEYVQKLYDFLESLQAAKKLEDYAEHFREENQLSRAKEYEQIYRLVMELLEQIYNLLGEEEITLEEFKDILEAGFGEIEVGLIPQNVDRIVVGDMERTRLKQVKVLFFLGVNDGNIPRKSEKGGIISDLDREFLRESELELAPSPRQQMYIQRLYLYLNLTKPSHRLYLSFCKVGNDGKSVRPAYLIDMLLKMYPKMRVEVPANRPTLEQIMNPVQGLEFLAKGFNEYVQGSLVNAEEFFTLYRVYGRLEKGQDRDRLKQAAFARYRDSGLSKLVARMLYGTTLRNSISRLETFAGCAYRHFLQYGLSLKEREEFDFDQRDMGNVYHAVLESFGGALKENGLTWFDFSEEFAGSAVQKAMETYAAEYGDTVLYSSARNEYAISKMERVLTRTVLTLQKQLKAGCFVPKDYELGFQFSDDISNLHIALSEDERMYLRGRIDRVDVTSDEEHVYVKIIDYKSGNREFDLVALYYGLQLQLVVYMNAAMEVVAKEYPDKEVIPAAMLYYHVDDPMVEESEEATALEIEEKIQEKLRMTGYVNADKIVIDKLDGDVVGTGKSTAIPVGFTKAGAFTSNSKVMTQEEFEVVSDYAGKKIVEIGKSMLEGCISVNPSVSTLGDACEYCSYKKICEYDSEIPGYRKRKLDKLEKEEILEQMRK